MSALLYDAASSDLFTSLGSILTGLVEILTLVGAAVTFLVRSRKNARRERLRAETAAALAAQEAKKQLETKLDKQHAAQIEQYKQQVIDINKRWEAQIDDLERSYQFQIEQFKQQLTSIGKERDSLLTRLLNRNSKESSNDGP